MEYDLAMVGGLREERGSHEKTRRDLKCILLSTRNQSEKAAPCVISATWNSGKGKTSEAVESL